MLGFIDPINYKAQGCTKENELESASISNICHVGQTIAAGKQKLATNTCFYIRVITILN